MIVSVLFCLTERMKKDKNKSVSGLLSSTRANTCNDSIFAVTYLA